MSMWYCDFHQRQEDTDYVDFCFNCNRCLDTCCCAETVEDVRKMEEAIFKEQCRRAALKYNDRT